MIFDNDKNSLRAARDSTVRAIVRQIVKGELRDVDEITRRLNSANRAMVPAKITGATSDLFASVASGIERIVCRVRSRAITEQQAVDQLGEVYGGLAAGAVPSAVRGLPPGYDH